MSDPLSVSAAVVGITVPALHATRLLLDDVNALVEAPKAVQRLKDDLVAVEAAYKSLASIDDNDWSTLGGDVAAQTKTTISACENSSASLHSDLKRWTRHSGGGTLSKRDRVNIGFFKERQLRAMSDHLQATKITLSSAVSMATLYSSFRNGEVTEDMKKSVVAIADSIRAATATVEDKLTDIEDRLASVRLKDTVSEEDVEDRKSAIRQLEDTMPLTEAQKTLGELLPKADEEKIRKALNGTMGSVSVMFGAGNQGMQVGISHGPISGITFGRK